MSLKMVDGKKKKKTVSALVIIITILLPTVAQGAPTPKYDPFHTKVEDINLSRLDKEMAIQ